MANRTKKISCIVLTCDSHLNKSYCVLHNLCSILNQDYPKIEIILVENSFKKDPKFLAQIKANVTKWNSKRKSACSFRIVNNQKSLDMGSARNAGAKIATGEILVFFDDDTIVTSKATFSKIAKLSDRYDCGYGAKRLWTKGNLFHKNSLAVLKELENGKTNLLRKISEVPSPRLRESNQSDIILAHTFITNFGFCRKKLFFKIGPFPSYPGYGFHDDYLMYRLFRAEAKTVLLTDISVVHVNHEIYFHPNKNIYNYFDDLVRDGYYWFDVEKIFLNKKFSKDLILQKLNSLHYDPSLTEAYHEYLKLKPLNLSKNSRDLVHWHLNNQFSLQEFARQIELLKNSPNVNEYVKTSRADFDNLAPVIDTSILHKFVEIDESGNITNGQLPTPSARIQLDLRNNKILAKSQFNQFPCDEESSDRRISFLRSRYPFAEYLKIAFIGDDDLLSLRAASEIWLRPVIIEKDKEITNLIKNISPRFEIIDDDIRKLIDNKEFLKTNKIKTFITDPPYTLNGILTFILLGLEMLDLSNDGNEFYVILNETMTGKAMHRIQKILSDSGIYIKGIKNNFSSYKLPPLFSERARANTFLKTIKVNESALDYSSSSNLYIFWTKKPDTLRIKKIINPKLIYNHYE